MDITMNDIKVPVDRGMHIPTDSLILANGYVDIYTYSKLHNVSVRAVRTRINTGRYPDVQAHRNMYFLPADAEPVARRTRRIENI